MVIPYRRRRSKYPSLISITIELLGMFYDTGKMTENILLRQPAVQKLLHIHQKKTIQKALARLHQQRIIKIQSGKSKTFQLTKTGSKEAFRAHMAIKQAQYEKPQAWDGTWRLVIFDVPEKYRYQRDYLRDLLKGLGFFQLQKSTWITPYPIPEFFASLLEEERIIAYARILHVDEIDYDKDLREHFQLTEK